MILIFDDTFEERKAEYPVSFLSQEKYTEVVKIFSMVKGNEINSYESIIKEASCIAYHGTFKFYGNSGNTLSKEQNIKIFDRLELIINNNIKPYISFSGSNISIKLFGNNKIAINKRQFYYNLEAFLDYYIASDFIELKVLIYGKNWIGYELLGIQNNIFYILDRNESFQNLDEFKTLKTKLFSELIRFNEIANIFIDQNLWFDYLFANYKPIWALKIFLDKTVKSYLKYGKYIYNL